MVNRNGQSQKHVGAYSLVQSRARVDDEGMETHQSPVTSDMTFSRAAARLRKAMDRFEPAPGTQARIAAVGPGPSRVSRVCSKGTGIYTGDMLLACAVVLGVNMEHLYLYLTGGIDLDTLARIRETFPRQHMDVIFRLSSIEPPTSGGSGLRRKVEP
jgi:hypothetical protein